MEPDGNPDTPPGSPPDLYAHEELDSFFDDPIQDARLSSTYQYYSGTKRSVPHMRSECFIYIFPECCTGTYGNVFIETNVRFKLSEYNFGACFDTFNTVTMKMNSHFHTLFNAYLNFKWPNYELEYVVTLDNEKGFAFYDFPNIDYWPAILAIFAFQCSCNNIQFFENVRLITNENTEAINFA